MYPCKSTRMGGLSKSVQLQNKPVVHKIDHLVMCLANLVPRPVQKLFKMGLGTRLVFSNNGHLFLFLWALVHAIGD